MKDILSGLPEINSLTPEQEVELISEPATLALHGMREAFYYAKKCCRGMLTDDDIYSACYDALCKAAVNFKPGKIRFFGYAKPYIRGALSSVWKTKDVVKHGKNGMFIVPDVDPSLEFAEEADGITGVLFKEQRKNIPLPPSIEPEMSAIQSRDEWALVEPLMKSILTDKEQAIIKLYYVSGLSFERIGKLLGSSRADCQATNSRALKKLNAAVRTKLGHC